MVVAERVADGVPDTVEDRHKVGEVLMEGVVDRDPVMVPEVQGERVLVDVVH